MVNIALALDKYKKRLNAYNSSNGTSKIESIKRHVLKDFEQNPSYFSVLINEIPRGLHIVDENTLTKEFNRKKILSKPNEFFNIGEYVIWDEKHWIVIIVDFDKKVQVRGIIKYCNDNLRWIENGTIHSFPCIFEFNTRSNFGVKDDRVMSLPDGRRQVVVQKNEFTSNIQHDKRFIFGKRAYRVIDHDDVSDNGLVNLSLEDDQVSVMDNLELQIANYYGEYLPPEIIEPEPDGYTIAITGYDEIYQGDTERYEVTLYKNGDPVVEDVIWELFADNEVDETNLAVIKEQTNEYCQVESKSSSGYVRLKVGLVSDNEVSDIKRVRLRLY